MQKSGFIMAWLNVLILLKMGPLISKISNLSFVFRKLAFCICKNKDADQLRSNCVADQRLCFCYSDSTIPLLPKSDLLLLHSPVCVGPGRNPRRPFFSQLGSICHLFSESKLDPLWNIILDSNKQLLVSEKYLSSVGNDGKCMH